MRAATLTIVNDLECWNKQIVVAGAQDYTSDTATATNSNILATSTYRHAAEGTFQKPVLPVLLVRAPMG